MAPTEQSGGVGWPTDRFGINRMVSIEKAYAASENDPEGN